MREEDRPERECFIKMQQIEKVLSRDPQKNKL